MLGRALRGHLCAVHTLQVPNPCNLDVTNLVKWGRDLGKEWGEVIRCKVIFEMPMKQSMCWVLSLAAHRDDESPIRPSSWSEFHCWPRVWPMGNSGWWHLDRNYIHYNTLQYFKSTWIEFLLKDITVPNITMNYPWCRAGWWLSSGPPQKVY